MSNISIASVMVCGLPKYLHGRLILSGYDGVWEAVEEISDDLKKYFTDDIGNEIAYYGGFLQIINSKVLDILNERGFFVCFRGVHEEYLEYVQAYPPKEIYQGLMNDLKFMGWDISTGNGWRSASCDGYFPIDPFTGAIEGENISQINEYGLFRRLENCLEYCLLNNEKIPEDKPWYPVAIYVDCGSYKRLNSFLNSQRDKQVTR